jgi:hypothetical protein
MAKVLQERSGLIAPRWQSQRSHLRAGRAACRFFSAIALFSCNRTGAGAAYGRRPGPSRGASIAVRLTGGVLSLGAAGI